MNTLSQYLQQVKLCSELAFQKHKDYGSAWRILRLKSLTDQIYIKAKRVRELEEIGEENSKIQEGVLSEYRGIANYCIISLIQSDLVGTDNPIELNENIFKKAFETKCCECKDLMQAKNHDYGEAWRDMRISSLTDLILMKIFRTKQIEDNNGQTLVSEGLDANYQDIFNYAIFALIKLSENGRT